ncbi:MAG: glycosyltransferase involved in cell wall biosynthesis [Kiritimatiellia bacterium]|jgi:glycosyltransferase involved in cell wall biosynthesis
MDIKNIKLTPGISIVVPVYRSSESLPPLIEELGKVLPTLTEQFECILVNDGSPDNSRAVMHELSEKHAWIKPINMLRNFGQHNALLCGIRHARYDVLVTMDDDLQHPPAEIAKLLARLNEGYDVVYGPPEREKHSLFRNLASFITKLALQGAMGAETARQSSAFRVFRTRLRRAFADYQSPNVSIDVLLTWATTKFSAVPVRHEPRAYGTSGYTVRKLISHALNMMTGFSTLPLRFANVIGFCIILFGFGVFLHVMYLKIRYETSVPGFAFLSIIISVFAGAQLMSLGIMGEYLARMHTRMMDRPTYVVDPDNDE